MNPPSLHSRRLSPSAYRRGFQMKYRNQACQVVRRSSWLVAAAVLVAATAGGLGIQPNVQTQASRPAPVVRTSLAVIQSRLDGSDVYLLSLIGDAGTAGPGGVFYRTDRPIHDPRVIEIEPP